MKRLLTLIKSNWHSPDWYLLRKKKHTKPDPKFVCEPIFSVYLCRSAKKIHQMKIDSFNLPVVMIESFLDDARIQKLIDLGKASDVHSNVTFCPMAAPTSWFWIIIIGGTVQIEKKGEKNIKNGNQTKITQNNSEDRNEERERERKKQLKSELYT